METIDTVHDGLRTFLSEQAPLVQQAKCIEARVEAAEGRGEGGGEEGIATNLRRLLISTAMHVNGALSRQEANRQCVVNLRDHLIIRHEDEERGEVRKRGEAGGYDEEGRKTMYMDEDAVARGEYDDESGGGERRRSTCGGTVFQERGDSDGWSEGERDGMTNCMSLIAAQQAERRVSELKELTNELHLIIEQREEMIHHLERSLAESIHEGAFLAERTRGLEESLRGTSKRE
jgi:hypothetical protein